MPAIAAVAAVQSIAAMGATPVSTAAMGAMAANAIQSSAAVGVTPMSSAAMGAIGAMGAEGGVTAAGEGANLVNAAPGTGARRAKLRLGSVAVNDRNYGRWKEFISACVHRNTFVHEYTVHTSIF